LALFLPGLFLVLPAGHVADRFDRRRIILTCYGLQALCTMALLWLSLTKTYISHDQVWPIYAVLLGIGVGRAFSGPASSAMLPSLVPKDHFVNAVTWGATIYQTANMAGPTVGGLLFTLQLSGMMTRWNGAGIVYVFTLVMLVGFLVLVGMIRTKVNGVKTQFKTKLLLGSISLDLFAVLLGGAVALLPIFATDILHAGPRGLGLLRAMPAVGALAVSLLMVVKPIQRRAGWLMLACVGIFGAATVVFGLSKNIWLSLIALVFVGGSDMVSVVIRGSVLQLATPPEMRGRVSAVNWLFIGASNEFGEFESGLTAHWWGAVRAVVVGGIGTLVVMGAAAALFPALRRADALTAESLMGPGIELSVAEPVD
jgi:MFS family permease